MTRLTLPLARLPRKNMETVRILMKTVPIPMKTVRNPIAATGRIRITDTKRNPVRTALMIRPESRMNRIKIQLIGRAFFGRPASFHF